VSLLTKRKEPTRTSGGPRARVEPRRRRKWLDRFGWYELLARGVRSSTRQVSGLFLGTSAAPTTYEGVLVGKEQHSGWPFFLDVFTAYEKKILSSPNVAVIGAIGTGKSSFLKTWAVLRQLFLGRRVVVIDKKNQRRGRAGQVAEGEYAALARALGIEPIRFAVGEATSTKINVLDPALASQHADSGASQMQLLRAILLEALGRPVAPLEGRALAVAREAAVAEASAQARVADIRDVVRHMEDPQEAALRTGGVPGWWTVNHLRQWGAEAGAELGRLVREDLKGLVDGPTSADVSLTAGLTVFDISALPDDGPAVPIVMAIISSWMRAVLDSQVQAVPTVSVVEEGWHLVSGSFAKVTQANTKTSRGKAWSGVFAFHHLSDVPADSAAISAIKEAGVVVMYRQDKLDDAQRVVELFNLPPATVQTLMTLPQGACLIKVGSQKPVLVTHLRSPWEAVLTDTDDAMTSTATVGLHRAA